MKKNVVSSCTVQTDIDRERQEFSLSFAPIGLKIEEEREKGRRMGEERERERAQKSNSMLKQSTIEQRRRVCVLVLVYFIVGQHLSYSVRALVRRVFSQSLSFFVFSTATIHIDD
jgi:hypothetical protein